MGTLTQDLRYAIRTLRKSPLFTAVAVLSLALGIGANTAIFTLIHRLILQYLPVRNPEELVLLTARGQHYGSNTGANALSHPMYQDFRDQNKVFSGMFCRHGMTFSVAAGGRTELVAGETVSGNYFPVLGVGAALGRVFTASDDLRQSGHPVAVLSYGYWKSRFGGDASILGKRVVVNGYPLTIVGVSQAGFDGVEPGFSPKIRVPMTMQDDLPRDNYPQLNNRRRRFVQVFGRLKPGVTLEQAKAGLQPLFHQILNLEVLQPAFAKTSPYMKQQFLKMWMDVLPGSKGRSQLRQQFSKPLFALMAIVGLVLLIACSNLANLLIARASARQKEIAVRLALGAGRWRLVRQFLIESLLLSVAGGAAGMALAVWMNRMLLTIRPSDVWDIAISAAPDGAVLAFTLSVSLLTALVFGLAPALKATRPELAPTLKDEAGSVAGGSGAGLRKTLVVAQVALSLLLLVGAGLFLRSLANLKELNPGFQTRNLVTFAVEPTLGGYRIEWTRQYYRQLRERLERLPGVTSAALAVIPVLSGDEWDNWVTIEGYTPKQGETPDPHMQFTTPGFFQTLRIPLLVGRDFTARSRRAEGRNRQSEVREEVFRGRQSDRTARRTRHRSGNQDRHRDRRRRGGHQVREHARRGPRGDVPAVCAAAIRDGHDRLRADRCRAAALPRRDSPRRAGGRRLRPALRDAHAGRADGPLAGDRAAAGDAVECVRSAGDIPCRDRALRRDGVHGVAPHARDRHPDGARRQPRAGGVAGDARGARYGRGRRRHRPGLRAGAHPPGSGAVVRPRAHRSGDAGRRHARRQRHGRAVRLFARPPRHRHRSDPGAAVRVDLLNAHWQA
jgi:predicted permease